MGVALLTERQGVALISYYGCAILEPRRSCLVRVVESPVIIDGYLYDAATGSMLYDAVTGSVLVA